MVNETEEQVRLKYEALGYKVLRNGAPDFVIFKHKDGQFSDVKWIEVKTGSNGLSNEQGVYIKLLKSLGLSAEVEYINKPNQINASQDNTNQTKTNPFKPRPPKSQSKRRYNKWN